MSASNEYKSTDQMKTFNFSQILLSGRNEGYLFEPEYTQEEILQRRRPQENVQQCSESCRLVSILYYNTQYYLLYLKCDGSRFSNAISWTTKHQATMRLMMLST